MTPLFRDPLLWLRRVRNRCGYGVHSPFAFLFIVGVVYETLPFYAFADLEKQLKWQQKFRVRRYLRLLFRLVNYLQPELLVLGDADSLERDYLCAARQNIEVKWLKGDGTKNAVCPKVKGGEKSSLNTVKNEESDDESGKKCLVFLSEPNDEALSLITSDSMLVLANVHRYKEWWASVPKVVSFDLYDLGIAFFDKKYNKQDYIVNF